MINHYYLIASDPVATLNQVNVLVNAVLAEATSWAKQMGAIYLSTLALLLIAAKALK